MSVRLGLSVGSLAIPPRPGTSMLLALADEAVE